MIKSIKFDHKKRELIVAHVVRKSEIFDKIIFSNEQVTVKESFDIDEESIITFKFAKDANIIDIAKLESIVRREGIASIKEEICKKRDIGKQGVYGIGRSLWPDKLLEPVGLLKARLDVLETRLLSGDKLDLICEFKKAIKLIENSMDEAIFSNTRADICKRNKLWETCFVWTDKARCLKSCKCHD